MIASRRTRAIYAVPECTEAHVFQSIQQLDSGGNSDGRGLRRPASRAASALLEKMSFSGSLGVASETKDSTLSSMSCGLRINLARVVPTESCYTEGGVVVTVNRLPCTL